MEATITPETDKVTVTIYHRIGRDRFLELDRQYMGTPAIVRAYEYEMPVLAGHDYRLDTLLTQVWRANNRVDGSVVEVVPEGSRSMCVGDVVAITHPRFGGMNYEFHTVKSCGWGPVSLTDFMAYVTEGIALKERYGVEV